MRTNSIISVLVVSMFMLSACALICGEESASADSSVTISVTIGTGGEVDYSTSPSTVGTWCFYDGTVIRGSSGEHTYSTNGNKTILFAEDNGTEHYAFISITGAIASENYAEFTYSQESGSYNVSFTNSYNRTALYTWTIYDYPTMEKITDGLTPNANTHYDFKDLGAGKYIVGLKMIVNTQVYEYSKIVSVQTVQSSQDSSTPDSQQNSKSLWDTICEWWVQILILCVVIAVLLIFLRFYI